MSANKEEYEKSHLYRIRHSTAHVMAEAVLEKFPTGRVAIGPPIEDGFYYDFDLPRSLTPEDLAEIEERMKQLIAQKESFNCEEISAQDARKLFADQPFKLNSSKGWRTAAWMMTVTRPMKLCPSPSINLVGSRTSVAGLTWPTRPKSTPRPSSY